MAEMCLMISILLWTVAYDRDVLNDQHPAVDCSMTEMYLMISILLWTVAYGRDVLNDQHPAVGYSI